MKWIQMRFPWRWLWGERAVHLRRPVGVELPRFDTVREDSAGDNFPVFARRFVVKAG